MAPSDGTRGPDASARKTALFVGVALLLQTLYSGIRFVDGSALLALARDGFAAQIPSFGQYLFDSPLKVLVLWLATPESFLAIALVFAATLLLPFLAFRLCFGRSAFLGALVVFSLTPMLKVLLQSIGIGDGVTIALYTVALFGGHLGLALAGALLLPLWHFQQGSIVLVFAACVLYLRNERGDRRRALALGGGLAAGTVLFVAYKLFAAPPSHSRWDWIVQSGPDLVARNLYGLPILLASAGCLGGLLLAQRDALRGQRSLLQVCTALAALALVASMLATDASRIFLLLTLPMLLLLLEGHIRSGAVERDLWARPELHAALAFACVLVPLFSWSGIDLYLWRDLVVDIRKYL